ncbi:hypothetical protein VIGAN_07079600, partial [Vigna angularis var. angularis]
PPCCRVVLHEGAAVHYCCRCIAAVGSQIAAASPPLDRKSPLHCHRWTAKRCCRPPLTTESPLPCIVLAQKQASSYFF